MLTKFYDKIWVLKITVAKSVVKIDVLVNVLNPISQEEEYNANYYLY